MLRAKYFIAGIMITSVFLSCTKSESFDVKGDPEVKFFVNNPNYGNAPVNSISYTVVNIPNTAGSGLVNLSSTIPAAIKFPVNSTRAVSQDVVIGAELDNSLIEAYNASNNTSYSAFPAGVFNTTGLVAHMNKGASISADSITIVSDLSLLNTLTGTAYMAPVKLTTVSNSGAGAITGNGKISITYIVVNVEQRKIKYLAAAAEALGLLVTPRTPWAVTFTPAPSTVGNIIDGSTATYSRWTTPVTPYGQVDVNMQAAKNVTGIRLYTSSSSTSTPTQVNVYLSNDGITYNLIGNPLRANLTYASSYNYILFYQAIPAQYIRLQLYYSTSTSTNNGRLAEFDVYAN